MLIFWAGSGMQDALFKTYEECCSDSTQTLKLGKILSTRYIVVGKVMRGTIHTSGKDYRGIESTWAKVTVSSRILDVQTGDVIFSKQSEGESRQYENWVGNSYHALLVEAVENATNDLVSQFIQSNRY